MSGVDGTVGPKPPLPLKPRFPAVVTPEAARGYVPLGRRLWAKHAQGTPQRDGIVQAKPTPRQVGRRRQQQMASAGEEHDPPEEAY